MTAFAPDAWTAASRRRLFAEIRRCAAAVRERDTTFAGPHGDGERCALDVVVEGFALTRFETTVLVLCAGAELDPELRTASPSGITFGLAARASAAPDWTALAPSAPLRRFALIEDPSTESPRYAAPLCIADRVLHYLLGSRAADESVDGIERVAPATTLVASHDAIARRIAAAWGGFTRPAITLSGADEPSRRAIAAAAAERANFGLLAVDALSFGEDDEPADARARLWEREAVLLESALYLNASELDPESPGVAAVRRAAERIARPVVLSTAQPARTLLRPTLAFAIATPAREEQQSLWTAGITQRALDAPDAPARLAAEFDFGPHAIAGALDAAAAGTPDEPAPARLWTAAREQTRRRLADLAQRIEPAARWDELVLPDAQREQLRDVVRHVAHRARVYDAWGFAARGPRGLGISALFAGPSGTGKTMAAEVLAGELELDLHRVDLASVMNKYIGETEKNLRRLFDAADAGGTILFFDEAESLFGKRTAIRDAHDRYANAAVDYLLQRVESYHGLAVLATNAKADIDPAFLRRLRFVVDFPFPDRAGREAIWRGVFTPRTPLADLAFARVARISVAGGSIRNIALDAAFRAAGRDDAVTQSDVLAATRAEFRKLERPLPPELEELSRA